MDRPVTFTGDIIRDQAVDQGRGGVPALESRRHDGVIAGNDAVLYHPAVVASPDPAVRIICNNAIGDHCTRRLAENTVAIAIRDRAIRNARMGIVAINSAQERVVHVLYPAE